MATDGPTPPPCDPEIFSRGKPVALLSTASNAAERWVKLVAQEANAMVDWHYSGGVAQVLHLGDSESRQRVEGAIDKLSSKLKGQILHRYAGDEKGLHRKGVTEAPPNSIATFNVDGEALYLLDED